MTVEFERLFPRSNEFRNRADKKAYIEGQLVKLAEEQRLYLTEVLNQPEDEANLAGEVLLGIDYNEDTKTNSGTWPTDQSLQNYRIKLEAIKWTPNGNGEWKHERDKDAHIRFRDGFKSTSRIALSGASGRRAQIDGISSRGILVDNMVDLGGPEVSVVPRLAWKALKANGLYVQPHVRQEAVRRHSIIREIPPSEQNVTIVKDARKS